MGKKFLLSELFYKYFKIILFTLAIGIATLTSCTEDDSTTVITPVNDLGMLVKKDIITYTDGSTDTANYTYDGNKLMRVEIVGDFGNGPETEIEEFTYTGELLTRIDEEYFDSMGNPVSNYTILEYDSSNRLITETRYYSSNTDVNTYVHNTDGTVTFNEDGGEIYIPYVNGNLITENNTNGDSDYTSTYDDKNGAFKNIHQREVFELLGHYAFNNNLMSFTNTGGLTYPNNETYSYTYNSADYPIASTNVYYPGTANEEFSSKEYFYE